MTGEKSDPEREAPSVMRAAEAVAYQDGGVVSRVVLKAEKGNVTLFAFDEGQELSEHSAPFDALVHVLEGEARVTIGGVDHAVRAGEMILLPADVPHALAAPTRFRMALTMIRT